jgi:hypothetical protein
MPTAYVFYPIILMKKGAHLDSCMVTNGMDCASPDDPELEK